MRVAVPLGGTDWGKSGIGTYVRAVLPALKKALWEKGSELFVIGNEHELDAYRDTLRDIETVTAPPWANQPGPSVAWYMTLAAQIAMRRGADVILYPAAQRRCSFHQPVPTVSVVHDLGQLKVDDKYDRLRMFYFKQVALRMIKWSTVQVAISTSTRDELVHALGLDPASIPIVPNGVDCARFAPRDREDAGVRQAREATGLVGPYLLYPARLEHPAKNHLRLLEAFAQSSVRDSHLLALSGGDWGGKTLIEERIAALGIQDRVKLLGFVAEEHLPALIAGADAVMVVGLTEGFGLPALEALAAGRPVCVARAGALPEVVGDVGAMCDPLDVESIRTTLEKAALDTNYRAMCAEAGPVWARRFSWDVTGQKLAEVCLAAARATS